jgi:predicted Ser/Thr protein kinase
MLAAIGEPEMIDTRHDSRLSRIFGNKIIRVYPAFKDFYGWKSPIEQVVACFRHAAQGLEEKKQILYLLGPVGGGKSSIAERLKQLMEQVPFSASRARRSTSRRSACSTTTRTPRCSSSSTASRAATPSASCRRGP